MASGISKRQTRRGRQSLPDNPLTSLLENEEKQEFEREYETRRRREMRRTMPSTLTSQVGDFDSEKEVEQPPQGRGKLPRRTKPLSSSKILIKEIDNGPFVKRRIGPSSTGFLDLDVYDLENDVEERLLRISPSLVETRPMSPLRRQRKLLSSGGSGQDKLHSEVDPTHPHTAQDDSAREALQSNESRSEKGSGPAKGNESSRRPAKRLKTRILGKHPAARSNIDTNDGVAIDRVDLEDAVKGVEPVNDETAELNEDTAHVPNQPKPVLMQSSRVRKRPRGRPRLSVTFEDDKQSSRSKNTMRTSNGTQDNRSKKSQVEKRQADSIRDPSDLEADSTGERLQQRTDAAAEPEISPKRDVAKPKELSQPNDVGIAPDAIQPEALGPNPETATDEQDEEENTSRAKVDKTLLGQRKVLAQAFAVMAEANFEGTRAAKRSIAKEILSLCEKATEKFNTMRINGHSAESRLDVSEEISTLEQQVLALQGRSSDKQINRHDHPLIRDIYQHIIPAFLKLCNKSVLCFEAIDKDQASGLSMTTKSLQTVTRIVGLVVDTGESLKRNEKGHITKALSAISDEVVQTKISSGVIIPFRAMRHKFTKYIDRQHRRAEQALMEEQQTAAIELHIEHEDLAHERQSRLLPIRRRWDSLHVDRLYIAGLIPERERRRLDKPKCPKDPKVIFVRGDSDEAERVEVLTVRIGPPPALIQKAAEHIWTNEQLLALHDGLRDFAGGDVLNKIIQKHCGKGRVLNAYTVTEIVTMAAMLKEQLERHQFESQGDIDGWVKGIPVWTEARVLGSVEEVGRGFGDDEE